MDRRSFLTASVIGVVSAGASTFARAAERYYPVKVDTTLFSSINRVKQPGKLSPLEMSHAPAITAPASVKAGDIFMVEVSVGEKIHVMGHNHWIEYIELAIGNQPVGRVEFQSNGLARPKASFAVAIGKEDAPDGKVSLVATQRCNLHGLWESSLDISVV